MEEVVIYIDSATKEHVALVLAERYVPVRGPKCEKCNHPTSMLGGVSCLPGESHVTPVLFDEPLLKLAIVEAEDAKILPDVMHHKHPSKDEANEGAVRFAPNSWKYMNERHEEMAEDHPHFDHPFAQPERNANGHIIERSRPEFEAQLRRHRDSQYEASAAGEPEQQAVPEPEQQAAPVPPPSADTE